MRSLYWVGLLLAVLGQVACANLFSLESTVTKDTRRQRAECEAAAKAGADTTQMCRAFLVPQ